MNITRLTSLILLLCSLSLAAQITDKTRAKLSTRLDNRLALKVEYFGELVLHPGLSVGVDYTLSSNKWLTMHWDTGLGGYWHRWNNTSAFLKTSIGSRFTLGHFFTDLNLGIGYMHTWAAGDMYQRAEDGGVERAPNRGHAHFMPNASFLLGWQAGKKNKHPWRVHIGPEIYLQSAFNHIFLPHLATKIGFTYTLNHR